MSWDLFSSAEPPSATPVTGRRGRGAPDVVPSTELLAGTLRTARVRPGEELSVSQVNAAAKELIEGVFPPLWITGEIANFTRARSGHCYFTLRDEESQLRCVMWRDAANRLPTAPQEGMAVRAMGRLTMYAARGEFQLSVSELEAKGEGLWKLALERMRQKLEAEGLTSPQRKRPLPRHPRILGVVTSPSGAVFHDIVNVVRRRAPWTRVVLAGCRVQGEGSATEVASAIRRIAATVDLDVLIVGRGGGSVEDLWAFNEEIVARAIAECRVPVISAVGHETDVTIADLVADLRAPTPSAAAEAAVPDGAEIVRLLGRDRTRLDRSIRFHLDSAGEALLASGVDLREAAAHVLEERRERLWSAARHLEALSPLAAFRRGYAVPLAPDGSVLRRSSEFEPGAPFTLRIQDGSVACRVEDDPR
jgi:exodeoxyribonuclease VII large subunit